MQIATKQWKCKNENNTTVRLKPTMKKRIYYNMIIDIASLVMTVKELQSQLY